jgi:hypothetical protein
LYTPAPAYGLSTRLQFGGVHVGPVGPPVVVGGRDVVVVGGREVVVGGRLVVVVGGRDVVVVGGREVVVGGRLVVVVGGCDVEPPQVTPLTVKDAGPGLSLVALGCVPVQLPIMPTELTTPPVGTLPFQDRFVMVMFWPDGVKLAFQPEPKVCPAGNAKVMLHDVHASPVLVMIGVTW